MKFTKLQEDISIEESEAEKPEGIATFEVESHRERSKVSEDSVIYINKAQIKQFVIKIGPYLLFLFICIILYQINNMYLELNQVCPFSNDFDCYYRYLLCEDDCSIDKPLYLNDWTDLSVEPRKDELLLRTRLAGMIFRLIILSAIYAILLTFAIFKKSYRFFAIIIVANLMVLRFYRDGKAHGDYTKTLGNWLIILTTFLTALSVSIVLGIRLSGKGRVYGWGVVACTFFFVIFLPANLLIHRYRNSCADWDKGLYGERMDNTINCQFTQPNFCLYDFIGDIFDYNQWLMLSCEDRSPDWRNISSIYPQRRRIGFPTLTQTTKEERQYRKVPKYVLSNLKPVNEDNEKNFEVILNRTPDPKTAILGDPAHFDINVHFNEQLVAERSKLISESLVNNVMVIYLNGLSRRAAFRRLKETMKVLENMSPKVHQFFKYHSITPYATGTLFPLFYNITLPFRPNSPEDKVYPSFVHEYKNKGFITGRALGECALSVLDTSYEDYCYRFIDEEPFDHIGNGWACDLSFLPKYSEDITTGPTSLLRRCVHGRDISDYVLEYGGKFWKTYENQKKLLWLDLLDFRDETFSQGKYLDAHLSKFLKGINLDDTMLVIMSDYGYQISRKDGLLAFVSTRIERASPALFIKLPTSLEPVYGNNLEENKNQIVQAFDLNTLLRTIPDPSLVRNSMLYPIMANKTKGCDFPMWEQDCYCNYPDEPIKES